MTAAWRIARYLRCYWATGAAAYLCLLLVSLIDLYLPDLVRQVIDCGINRGAHPSAACNGSASPYALAGWTVSVILCLTLVKGLLQWAQGYLGEYGAQGIAYDLRRDLYAHLQRLSFSYHDQAQTGQLMSRATADVEQLRNFTGRGVLLLAQIRLLTVGITILLFAANWKLALASIVALPLLIRTVTMYNRAVRPLFRKTQDELAVLATIAQENIAGARVVKAFAREPHEIAKFNTQNAILQNQYLTTAEITAFTNPLLDVISQIGTVVVLWLGGYLIIVGELTVGQLVAFNAYLLLLIRPARRIGFLSSQGAQAIAAAERLFEVLDTPVEIDNKPGAAPLPPTRGEVVFEHVWCSYGAGEPVLRDISFTARPGQTIALLGATGSGKSTVVNLIPRFYDVTRGCVRVDGHDVRDLELGSLRRQIGMVLQDTVLFSGTIRDNIAFGAPDATDEEVFEAARAARADAFITELPRGYGTRVGERGMTLSGGQKQRIAIARALLLNPGILILDDFTSAVDTETEALIREALSVLMLGRTTFIIAQRVSTVRSADLILVLDHGEVVGRGKHEELLQTNRVYADIDRLQLADATAPPDDSNEPEAAPALAGVDSRPIAPSGPPHSSAARGRPNGHRRVPAARARVETP